MTRYIINAMWQVEEWLSRDDCGSTGFIRDALGTLGLAVLFVGVVYLAYGFGMGGL